MLEYFSHRKTRPRGEESEVGDKLISFKTQVHLRRRPKLRYTRSNLSKKKSSGQRKRYQTERGPRGGGGGGQDIQRSKISILKKKS